jgi:hypothetical protein
MVLAVIDLPDNSFSSTSCLDMRVCSQVVDALAWLVFNHTVGALKELPEKKSPKGKIKVKGG